MAAIPLESQGRAVDVTLNYTVDKGQVAVIEGWLGLTNASGDSGDKISLSVDQREYQWEIPPDLSVAKGDIVYITIATVTGHTPDNAAYTTTSGAGKRALFRATTAHYTGANGNRTVNGIMSQQGS